LTLERFVKVKGVKRVQKVVIEKLRDKTFRVITDIDVMAIDDEGDVYPEVFRKGDIISGKRFDEKFLEVLLNRKIIEVV